MMPREERAMLNDLLYDVLAVNMETHKVTVIGKRKTVRNAEAIETMAVMRRGLDKAQYVYCATGTLRARRLGEEMDNRSTILINSKLLWVKIRTKADYNHKSQITLREWLSPKRYEVGVYRRDDGQGYLCNINKSESIWS